VKLLIVDDEPHLRRMMRLTLEAAGYAVAEAATGEDALARYGDGGEFDAVLLDQKMPGIDGLQTLERLKKRNPGARVLMVTAFASIDLAVDAMKLGATDFLRKPMTPETLRRAVSAALAGAGRSPTAGAAVVAERRMPEIQTLTLNGFRLVRSPDSTSPDASEHVFQVTQAPGGAASVVTVVIDPEAVARVARLSRRPLQPGGAFWRDQAERLLAAFLWSEGKPPANGRLTVRDISRADLDLASAWELD
jgi:DNA-binding response OmpR family regulator